MINNNNKIHINKINKKWCNKIYSEVKYNKRDMIKFTQKIIMMINNLPVNQILQRIGNSIVNQL